MMLMVAKYLIGFRWNVGVRKILHSMLPLVIVTFAAGLFLPEIPATIIGLIVTVGVSLFCMRGLVRRLGAEHKVCKMIDATPLLGKIINYGGNL